MISHNKLILIGLLAWSTFVRVVEAENAALKTMGIPETDQFSSIVRLSEQAGLRLILFMDQTAYEKIRTMVPAFTFKPKAPFATEQTNTRRFRCQPIPFH